MLSQVFSAHCVGCGEVCDFNSVLCADCIDRLERPEHRCAHCGYILSVPANNCGHCDNVVNNYYSDFIFKTPLRELIRSIKFGWRFRGASQLAGLCELKGVTLESYDAVTPVPYHIFRRFSRYVQPVDVIMKAIEQKCGCRVDLLKRVRNTEYQSRLSRKARADNMRGAFKVKTEPIKGMKILLVDDILTTGATVTNAAKLLKQHGAACVDVYTLMAGAPR